MNIIVAEMYSHGSTVSEIFEGLNGVLHHREINDILIDACLIQ